MLLSEWIYTKRVNKERDSTTRKRSWECISPPSEMI